MNKTPELFDQRNDKKKEIEFHASKSLQVDVGEFWRYREGVNIGNEISKDGGFKRVCLILDNDTGNGLVMIIPITTKYHQRMNKFYIKVSNREKYGLKECRLIINQVKLIDKKRLSNITGSYRSNISLVKFVKQKIIDFINKKLP